MLVQYDRDLIKCYFLTDIRQIYGQFVEYHQFDDRQTVARASENIIKLLKVLP